MGQFLGEKIRQTLLSVIRMILYSEIDQSSPDRCSTHLARFYKPKHMEGTYNYKPMNHFASCVLRADEKCTESIRHRTRLLYLYIRNLIKLTNATTATKQSINRELLDLVYLGQFMEVLVKLPALLETILCAEK
jgi:hypothetical protein